MINEIKTKWNKLKAEDKMELGTKIMTAVLWLIIIFALILVPQNAEKAKAENFEPISNLYGVSSQIHGWWANYYQEDSNYRISTDTSIYNFYKDNYIQENGLTYINTNTTNSGEIIISYKTIKQYDRYSFVIRHNSQNPNYTTTQKRKLGMRIINITQNTEYSIITQTTIGWNTGGTGTATTTAFNQEINNGDELIFEVKIILQADTQITLMNCQLAQTNENGTMIPIKNDYTPNGYDTGYTDGYQDGYTAGDQGSYTDGYEAGKEDGYQDGYTDGKLAGIDEEQLNQLNAQPNLLYNGQFTYSFTNQNSFYKTWTSQSDISSFVPYWNIQNIADNVTMAVSQNNAGNSALRVTAGNSNDNSTRASIYTDFYQTGIDRNNAVDHIKMLENTKYNLSIWVEESRQDEYEYGNITVGLMFIKTNNSNNEADWTIKEYIIPPNTSIDKGGTNTSWWTLEKFIFTTPQNENADWDLCRVIINFKNTVQVIVYDTKMEYGENYTGINVNKYAISKYGYSSAYNDGYTAGVVASSDSDVVAQQVSEAYNNGFTNGYINGNAEGSENGYNNGYTIGRENGYQAGKADGYNAGLEESNAYSWSSLIGSVVNAPINMIFGTPTKNETTGVIERQNGLLTWELPLGDSTLHIKEFVMGILSILLVAVVIKLVMKFIA